MAKPVINEHSTEQDYLAWEEWLYRNMSRVNGRLLKVIRKVRGEAFYSDLKSILEEGNDGELSIVHDTEKGKYQNEDFETIKGCWVDQYQNGGYTGDSYAGYCYIELKLGRYLKWHYSI